MRWWWLVVVLTACGTPSRRLPANPIDDPITVPRRMIQLAAGAAVRQPVRPWESDSLMVPATLRYGLTNRLEWYDVLSLRYAFCDDAPGAGTPGPLAVALMVGLRGFGYSWSERFVFAPHWRLDLGRRLGARVRARGALHWTAQLSALPEQSWLVAELGMGVRLARRLSLEVAGNAGWHFDRTIPSSHVLDRDLAATTGLSFRVFYWLTLLGSAGIYHSALVPARVVASPFEALPAKVPARNYAVVEGALAFQW